jgi:hypothetical protein
MLDIFAYSSPYNYCSVDGLHSVDLNRYIATHPNSNLSMIAKSGVVYQNAYIDGLTDSFPGLMGLVTGDPQQSLNPGPQ